MRFHEIELTSPERPVQFTHSLAMDMIQGRRSDQNIDWTDRFYSLPWDDVKGLFPHAYEDASRLNSLINMNYQVCNGGIAQYFYNGYHKHKGPLCEHDVVQYDLEEQKKDFLNLAEFACAVYPKRTEENRVFLAAAQAFQALQYEEDAPVTETIYCEEDEYIEDPDYPGEQIPNPDYFDPYDETIYENVITGEDHFETSFFKDPDVGLCASAYMEELFELRSQYLFKSLVKEMEERVLTDPKIADLLSIAKSQRFSLDAQIATAESKSRPAAEPDGRGKGQPERS